MNRESPLIIAHRGNSSEAPENTLAAINLALEVAVDFVEIDVRLSKDGVPVVIHDSTFLRCTGLRHFGSIYRLSFSQIQKVDVGSKFSKEYVGEKVPRLLDVLHLKWKKTGLMIEIKEGPESPATIVESIFQEISTIHSPLPKLVIGSFCLEIFNEVNRRIKELSSEVTSIGIVEKKERIPAFLDAGAKLLAVSYKLITPDVMKVFSDHDVTVWSFTIDDVDRANRLISLGVSGIISNTPRKMKAIKF